MKKYLLLALICISLPASAATLRLTIPADTTFNPGALDDTKTAGDTFILELWINASDTDVHGVEATLQYDGTQLALLESADATDSFFGGAGINSDEDHTVFGDIMANNGLAAGTGADTARYAALTYTDSTRANVRLARFLFQVSAAAVTGQTAITYKSTVSETTAITYFDTDARNVLTATDTGLILITAPPDTHVVLTAVSPGYTGASALEFVALYNPTSSSVDLTNYYLSDADPVYFDTTSPAVAAGDWVVRFPSGALIAANDTITVALSAVDVHAILPGVHLDYEITSSNTGIPDMTIVATSGTRAFTNAGEPAILFYWNGSSVGVQDVDMLVFGTGVVPNKTGTAGHVGDSASMTKPAAPAAGQILRRTSFMQGDTSTNERRPGGNGLTGHDETSESASVSWAASNDSMPWHTMLIAYKTADYSAAIAEALETGVEALRIKLRGARNTADTLTQIDLRTLGVADTENIDTVSLWIDANNDSIISTGVDTLVGNFTALTSRTWRFTGSLVVPANTGYDLMVGFAVADTVQNGETVVMQIDTQGLLMSVSDSGSFVALVNASAITLVKGILRVTKLADIAVSNFVAGTQNITVLSAKIIGVNTDTLTNIALDNLGSLSDTDVTVSLWKDINSNLAYDAGDSLIAVMPYVAGNGRWELNGFSYVLPNGGETVVWTISAFDTALIEGDTFKAVVPASSGDAVSSETGPALAVSNANFQRLINRPGIASHVVIAASYIDAAANDANGEWILLYNPTDTPQNLQNWKINAAGVLDATLPDSTIAARGWFLMADAGWVKDNAAWPNADHYEGITLNNSADGFSLVDSTNVVIDQFGYGATVTDYESGTVANPGSTDLYVRRPHTVATATDLLRGGRDEFGGAGYDSYDNATDFILITGTDTSLWPLRSFASTPETPAQKTTVVKILTNVSNRTASQTETGVTAAAFYIQGDTTATGTLTHFRVSPTNTIEDTNFTSIELYRDLNSNVTVDTGDSLVAALVYNASGYWETTGIAHAFNSLAGETFLVVLNIAPVITDGETFQATVAVRTVKASNADSGPTIARTNTGIITLSTLTPLTVNKHANIANDTVAPTDDTITVIAFRITGDPLGDTLTRFTIENTGALDTVDVGNVRLWRDANGDSQYTAGDTLVARLMPSGRATWDTTGISHYFGTSADFVVTIDLVNGGNLESFVARIPANGLNVSLFDTGPTSNVSEVGRITVSNAMTVNMVISEVNVDSVAALPTFVELYMKDDGNGGAGADVSGWKVADLDGGEKIFGDTDNNGTVDTPVIVRTGEYLVFWDGSGTDEWVSGGDNVVSVYNVAISFNTEDDQAVLYDNTITMRDAASWSDRDKTIGTEGADMQTIITAGHWSGFTQQGSAINAPTLLSLTAGTLSMQRDAAMTDRDSYIDWGFADPSPGDTRKVEAILTAPAAITGLTFLDVPNDQGGNMKATWTPDTSQSDFLGYRVYLETGAIGSLIAGDTNPFTTITDSSVRTYTFSGLTNGDSYWVSVTAVDSWGLERRLGNAETGPYMPIVNVTETPVLTISEVFANSSGADTDYIEIFVASDGNPTGNLNLSGWKIEWHTAGTKTLGDVTVATGEYLVLEMEEATNTDDADSGGDNVVTLRSTSTGITGTDAYVRVLDASNNIKSFVFLSDRDGSLAATVATAVRQAIDSGAWTGDTVQNAAVTPATGSTWNALDLVALAWTDSSQVTTRDSWSITRVRTKGSANTGIESPAVVPPAIHKTLFQDVPSDFGGSLEIRWTPDTSQNDFVAYQIYLDTVAIGTRLDTSSVLPNSTVTDSSIGTKIVSGLVNGDSYWVTVTMVDSWGHERRRIVAESGPVAPQINVFGTPVLRFSEVKFAGTDTEFIEIRVVNDGNAAGNLNIAGFKVTKDNLVTADIATFGSVTVGDSDYIVLWNKLGTSETDSGLDGVVNIYGPTLYSLAEGGENLFLIQAGGDTIIDFVAWAERGAALAGAEVTDVQRAIDSGAWANLGTTANNCVNPLDGNDFYDTGSITRDRNFTDNNADTDWSLDSSTPGAAPNMNETPFGSPAAVTGVDAADVPSDFGGQIRVVWNPVVDAQLYHYRIYRETTSIPASLYLTDSLPFTYVPATDTSITFSGLANGVNYWFAVTAVDSYGNERKTALLVDSAQAIANVSGETVLITEVSFVETLNGNGVHGHDWIEIYIDTDGTGGAGINLSGWKIVTENFPSLTFGTINANRGDFIVVHAFAGTDETDSMAGNADGIIDIYNMTALTATDNHAVLYRSDMDTEDFVAWYNAAPITSDTNVTARAIATGRWVDIAPAGVGPEDGVFSTTAAANNSIYRIGTTIDTNSVENWGYDTDPTPGIRNDSRTYWRITGTVTLESRALFGGVTVSALSATETFVTSTNNAGSYVIRVPAGVFTLRADSTHYLRKISTGVTLTTVSLLNSNIGVMISGDANGDNRIDIFDASVTKYAIDRATGNPAADHVDPVGVDLLDLKAVRDNFGRLGDP